MTKLDIPTEDTMPVTFPQDGDIVCIKRDGKYVDAIFRDWHAGLNIADVEYKGQTISTHLYEPSLDGGAPKRLDLRSLHTEVEEAAATPVAIPLCEFERPSEEDPNELLFRRFLCRGGGMLLVGPTGIGKSAFTMQAVIQWAIGLPVFGIQAAWGLKTLMIQAENDAGDIAEFRDGVLRGLDLTPEQAKEATERIIVCTNDSSQGAKFFKKVVRPLLEEHRPDLLVIDPALAYLGGETNSQRDVGGFLRNELNPLLKEFEVAAIIIHHTNKPPSGKEKSTWQGSELSYLGSGSAEWANWARAVLALRATGKADGEGRPIYELCAPKRGGRLDWRNPAGERVFSKFVRHSREPGVICWHEVGEGEVAEDPNAEKVRESNEAMFTKGVELLLAEFESVPKASVVKTRSPGLGIHRAEALLAKMVEDKKIVFVKVPRKGARPEVHCALNDGLFEG